MITPFIYKRAVIRVTKSAERSIDISSIIAHVPHQDILIIIEEGVQVTVYDTRINAYGSLHLRSILIHVLENAHVTYIDRHSGGDEFSVVSIQADVNSTFSYQGLYTGLCATKTILNLMLVGEGAHGELCVGSVARGKSCHFVMSTQRHNVSRTTSRCMIRSVVYDDAYTCYDGMIRIADRVQKSTAHQLHKSLLMGDRARATARPKLEIFSHDVNCGHGSAIGQLDDEQLFYLRCRGLAQMDARRLLVGAFFNGLYTDNLLLNALREEGNCTKNPGS